MREDGAEVGEVLVTRLRALAEIAGSVLDAVGNEHRLLSSIADVASQTLGGSASVWMLTPGDSRLDPAVLNHPEPFIHELVDALRTGAPDQPLPTARLLDGDPIAIVAGPDDPDPAAAVLAANGLAGMAVLPMVMRNRLLGVIVVTRDAAGGGGFDSAEVEFGLALAGVGGATVANARMIADSAAVVDDLRRQGELMDHISDAMISCDTEWRIVSWNAGAEQIYGYPRGEALGCDLFALLATEFLTTDGVPLNADEVLEQVSCTGGWRGELHERRADGAPLMIMSSLTFVTEEDHGPRGLIVVNRDLTDQRREEHQALHDALTGLPNRRLLTNKLYDALARSSRTNHPLAVLFLDLDGFKAVNDVYGHAAGDEVLRATGRRISGALRGSDTVARLGGDEFVLILEHAGSTESVTHVATRVIESVSELVDVGQASVSVRPSIGIAFADLSAGMDTAPEELIEAADEAMYVAKREKLGMSFAPSYLPAPADFSAPEDEVVSAA